LYRLVTAARPTTRSLYLILLDLITLIVFDAPQGLTIFVSTGSGAPEVPNASGQAYSWVTLSPGVINTDTWSFSLEVGRGLAISPRKTLHVSKPEDREARAGYRAEKKKIMMTVMMI
jgi:hypothetical protein